MKKIFFLIMVLMPLLSFAESIELILRNGVELDTNVQYLKKDVERAINEMSFASRRTPVSLDLSAGQDGIGVSWESTDSEAPVSLFLEPSISFNAGGKLGTQINLYMPVDLLIASEMESSVKVDLSVIQPLSKLVGLDFDNQANKMRSFVDLEQSRIKLYLATNNIQIELLDTVSKLYSIRKGYLQTELKLVELKKKKTDALSLNQYSDFNEEFQLLVLEVDQYQDLLESEKKYFMSLLGYLSDKCGKSIDTLPAEILFSEKAEIPDFYGADKENSSDLYLNSIQIALNEQVYRESNKEFPKINLLFNFRNIARKWSTELSNDISGGFSFAYKGIDLSLKVGSFLDENRIYSSIGLNYKLPDYKQKAYDQKKAKIDVELAQLEREKLFRSLKDQTYQLNHDYINNMKNYRQSIFNLRRKDIELNQRKLELEKGFTSEVEVRKLKLNREILKDEKNMIALAIHSLFLKGKKLLLEDFNGQESKNKKNSSLGHPSCFNSNQLR